MSISLISITNFEKWDFIVQSFNEYDVYYLSGYVKAFQKHGDGEPILLYYETDDLRSICVFMKRDLSFCKDFANILPCNKYFDIVTPYGYGGFLFEGNTSEDSLDKFNKFYNEFLKKENIVSEFVRFHPLLKNAEYMRDFSKVTDLGSTISLSLISSEAIWNNISSKNRNMIRKAEKNGVKIYHSKDWEIVKDFMEIYNKTMAYDNAHQYYYFKEDFYYSIHNDLYDNYEMFYAMHDNQIIAMSIIIYANNKMHYHLSGSLFEYRSLAPTNLLLYQAACWGASKGISSFHLGGGLGSDEDNLYKFKKSFNKEDSANNKFSIGKRIINNDIYFELVQIRVDENPSFNINSSFFPLYRQV